MITISYDEDKKSYYYLANNIWGFSYIKKEFNHNVVVEMLKKECKFANILSFEIQNMAQYPLAILNLSAKNKFSVPFGDG